MYRGLKKNKRRTASWLATAQESSSRCGKSSQTHCTSSNVSCVILTRNWRSVSACLRARESRNPRGMFVGPAVEKAFNVNDSSDGRGVRAQIHDQSCAGPCKSTQDVRTVSRRRSGKGASGFNGRNGHGRRYSVSSATRAGSEVRMSVIARLGAPFSRRSRRRES